MIKNYAAHALSILFAVAMIISSASIHHADISAQKKDTHSIESVSDKFAWRQMRLRDPATGKIPAGILEDELRFAAQLPGAVGNNKFRGNKLMNIDWSQNGPINIGGRTRALALDVLNEDIIIAGAVSGGMWRSNDAGETWTQTSTHSQMLSVSCVAQDTRVGKENIWYYGTGEFWGNSADLNGDGIYKSTDGGNSWFILPSTTKNTPNSWDSQFEYVWSIVTDHTNFDEDIVYAATTVGGIFRSSDGGGSWEAVLGSFGNRYSFFTDLVISPSGVLYATLSQSTFNDSLGSEVRGIYRSEDGLEWTNITPDDMPEKYKRVKIGIAPSDENIVYFIADSPGAGQLTTNSRGDSLWHSFWKYTYVSGDGSGDGGIWENRSHNIPDPELVRHQFNSQGSYDLVIKVKPDDPNVVFIGGVNLYRCNDALETNDWTLIGGTCPDDNCDYHYRYPNHHADQHEIIFLPSDSDVMLTGSDGGVHRTLNCMADEVEWISHNNGYYTTQFYAIALDHAEGAADDIVGGLQDNGTIYSIDGNINTNWTDVSRGDGFFCQVPDGREFLYTSQNSSNQPKIKMWRLVIDEKGLPTLKTRIDPIGGRDFIWNNPFVLDPNNNNRMYVAGGEILWRNNDLSQIPVVESDDSVSIQWDSLALPGVTIAPAKITALNISKNPANVLYFGTSDGRVFRLDNADATDDPPISELTAENFPAGYVGNIEIDPENADNVFVVFTNYNVLSVFGSTDGGTSWQAVSGNLEAQKDGSGPGPACSWMEILKVGEKKIYLLGTSTGLYSTMFIDGMNTTWKQEGANTIGNTVIDMIDVRESDGYVAVGTHGKATFVTKITSLPDPPRPPALLKPFDNAKAILDNTELMWEASSEASYYHLQVARDAEFQQIVQEFPAITKTAANVFELEQGYQTYYWRVFAKGYAGISEPSLVWSFTTAVNAPELIFPEDKADSVETDVNLQWQAVNGAVSYHLQVDDFLVFNNCLVDTIISANQFPLIGLDYNDKFYWRVSSVDEDGEGIYSETYNFRTKEFVSVKGVSEAAFKLGRCVPNPVKSNAEIHFALNSSGPVNIELYDSQGRKVRNLKRGYCIAGEHSLNISTEGLSSGRYYYSLTFGGKTVTESMNVIK